MELKLSFKTYLCFVLEKHHQENYHVLQQLQQQLGCKNLNIAGRKDKFGNKDDLYMFFGKFFF